jgi:hypothetical protein
VGAGHNVQITRLPMFPQYVGKRLDEIAKAEGSARLTFISASSPTKAPR